MNCNGQYQRQVAKTVIPNKINMNNFSCQIKIFLIIEKCASWDIMQAYNYTSYRNKEVQIKENGSRWKYSWKQTNMNIWVKNFFNLIIFHYKTKRN